MQRARRTDHACRPVDRAPTLSRSHAPLLASPQVLGCGAGLPCAWSLCLAAGGAAADARSAAPVPLPAWPLAPAPCATGRAGKCVGRWAATCERCSCCLVVACSSARACGGGGGRSQGRGWRAWLTGQQVVSGRAGACRPLHRQVRPPLRLGPTGGCGGARSGTLGTAAASLCKTCLSWPYVCSSAHTQASRPRRSCENRPLAESARGGARAGDGRLVNTVREAPCPCPAVCRRLRSRTTAQRKRLSYLRYADRLTAAARRCAY